MCHLQHMGTTRGPRATLRSDTMWGELQWGVPPCCSHPGGWGTNPSIPTSVFPSGKHLLMAMTYWTATCQSHKDDPEARPLPLVLILMSQQVHAAHLQRGSWGSARLNTSASDRSDMTPSQAGSYCLQMWRSEHPKALGYNKEGSSVGAWQKQAGLYQTEWQRGVSPAGTLHCSRAASTLWPHLADKLHQT